MSIYTPTEKDLSWLACPVCHGDLVLDSKAQTVQCVVFSDHRFAIIDGLMALLR